MIPNPHNRPRVLTQIELDKLNMALDLRAGMQAHLGEAVSLEAALLLLSQTERRYKRRNGDRRGS